MKARTKRSFVTLFSIGLISSPFFTSSIPLLLAQENNQTTQVAEKTVQSANAAEEPQASTKEAGEEAEPVDTSDETHLSASDSESESEQSTEPAQPGVSADSESKPEQSEEITQPDTSDSDSKTEPETSEDPSTEDSVSQPEESVEEDESATEDSVSQPEASVEEDESATEDSVSQPEASVEEDESATEDSVSQPEESLQSEQPKEKETGTQPKNPVIQPAAPAPSVKSSLTDSFYGGDAYEVTLPEAYRASEVAESDLLGFTLPALASYQANWQAALVYQVTRQIGEASPAATQQEWSDQLFEQVVDTPAFSEKQRIDVSQLQAGDLLYSKEDQDVLSGLYLAGDYQASLVEQEEAVYSTQIQKLTDQDQTVMIQRLQSPKLTKHGEQLIKDYPAPYDYSANPTSQAFIDTIAKDAQKLGQAYDVFASVLIAQGLLESGSGTSSLAQAPYYNLFGIKGSQQGNAVVLPTMEDRGNGELYQINAAFRTYSSYQSAMADYVNLIRGGISGNNDYYQGVWRSKAKNYLRATDALTGSYATDTTYNKKLNSIIAAYDLTKYDQPVVSETGLFIQGQDQIPADYRSLMKYPVYDGKDYNTSGSYPVGQCTWYAFNRVAQLGGKVDDYMGNGGEWGSTARRLGYQVSQTPKAGTVVSFTPGTAGSSAQYGHVAFVEAVGPEGILISEGNVYGGTTISYRVISNDLARSAQVSYITPK